MLPDVPHVAVFDTTFHATIPDEAAAYAVPRRWAEEWGVRRYGFHGLSVQWAAERAAVSRLVVCHLGGGCSVTAVRDGRSVDTSMGFSPLDGVPMATRSGTLDPEILLYLLRTGRLAVDDLERALEHESGLLGLSGVSARVDELERSDEPSAALALDVFTHRVAAAVAAMTTSLGGLDALVFTGGVGENSSTRPRPGLRATRPPRSRARRRGQRERVTRRRDRNGRVARSGARRRRARGRRRRESGTAAALLVRSAGTGRSDEPRGSCPDD